MPAILTRRAANVHDNTIRGAPMMDLDARWHSRLSNQGGVLSVCSVSHTNYMLDTQTRAQTRANTNKHRAAQSLGPLHEAGRVEHRLRLCSALSHRLRHHRLAALPNRSIVQPCRRRIVLGDRGPLHLCPGPTVLQPRYSCDTAALQLICSCVTAAIQPRYNRVTAATQCCSRVTADIQPRYS